jgi:DNA-directed RNA polymerase subunit beta
VIPGRQGDPQRGDGALSGRKVAARHLREKAQDVKDSSLRVPPGISGVVIDAKVFSRKGVDKDERSLLIEDLEIEKLNQDKIDELRSLRRGVCREIGTLLEGRTAKSDILDQQGEVIVKLGKKIVAEQAELIGFERLRDIDFSEKAKYIDSIDAVYQRYSKQAKLISERMTASSIACARVTIFLPAW